MNLLDSLSGGLSGSHSGTRSESGAQAGPEGTPICSRKACRQEAAWQLLWNNPRIHTPERRKTWLSCSEHRDWLEDYLRTRGLWKETLPLASGTQSGAL
ncbi:hypothetical protein LJ754_09045 [Arthrobacter sp. zg-Y40]|uniref:hypothetical protein n=1 Tax=Arthrobacter sp. zg-Y40 TaxID=2886939 RepID=UPI001D15D8CE|nr:hypothetical protein [Arthrobacter sp. zg-Y40]MCC3279299.1 hypothetical protein [Arthrobacter sp. zg-Y40]